MAHLRMSIFGGNNQNRLDKPVQKKNQLLTNWVLDFFKPKEVNVYESFSEDEVENVDLPDEMKTDLKKELRKRTITLKQERCEKLHRHMKILDSLLILLSNIGLVLEIYNYETNMHNQRNDRIINQDLDIKIKYATLISTVICLILAYIRSLTAFQMSREHKMLLEDPTHTYYTSSSFRSFMIDVAILSIFPYPFFDFEMEFDQLKGKLYLNFGSICLSYMMFRFLFLFRLFLYYSKWSTVKVQIICREYGAYEPLRFALKALLKDRPQYLLLPVFAISTVAFGIAVQIYEKPFHKKLLEGETDPDFSYLYNCMWLVLLTMTTVGFGDFYARTHVGRFITIMALIWGTFLISLMIIMLNNYVVFSRPQEKSFNYLTKLFTSRQLKDYASKFISRFLLIKALIKYRRVPLDDPELIKASQEMLHFQCMFRETIYKIKFKYPNIRDALLSMNDELGGDLKKLNTLIETAKHTEAQLDSIIHSQKKTIEIINNCSKFSRDSLVLLGMSTS